MPIQEKDLLKMDYINSLGQLFWNGFPVYDIDVETGFFRLDVCGMLDMCHIDSVIYFDCEDGNKYAAEDFYVDKEL